MSSAFVPGRIRRAALWSTFCGTTSLPKSSVETGAGPGEDGPIWTSAIGGGLGNRGELAGERAAMVLYALMKA